jgi:hypothetical protein
MSTQQILLFAGGFVASLVLTLALVAVVVVKLPADFFVRPRRTPFAGLNPVLRIVLIGLKNLLGIAVIAVGLVLSLPGMPGQGFMMILIGVMLVDFPGKQRFQRWMVRKKRIARALNWIRAKFRQPNFAIPHDPDPASP